VILSSLENDSQSSSRQNAVQRIRHAQALATREKLVPLILQGDKSALSRAITLAESTLSAHRSLAAGIIQDCIAQAGNSIRIGITGVPGVGKSTFIEAFGLFLAEKGHRVAVLAVDPSSPFSSGSILGDKTRMEMLSRHPSAYIRPSPSSLNPGGVTRHTRESIMLCEAAGYDVILVETVGVGQGEIAVHGMTDFFLLLMLAGAGDQLQGIKRGIMELCDALVITKSDGENVQACARAKGEYLSALHLFPPRESGWTPRVDTVSALKGEGIGRVWDSICAFSSWMTERGLMKINRQNQDVKWMHESIREQLVDGLLNHAETAQLIHLLETNVRNGAISPFAAAEQVVNKAMTRIH
jgi:LAO/AO transport system kinase